MTITSAQCRAARALLNWNQQELAAAAGVGVVTVRQFELGASQTRAAMVAAMETALNKAGVLFMPENGEGAGVRLRKAGA